MITVAIIVIAVSVGAGVYGQNTNADDVVIKASVNKDCTGTPWFAGVEKGFFKNAGVSFKDLGPIAYQQRASAFANGQTDAFDDTPAALITLIKSGVPIIGVAQSGDEPLDGDLSKARLHWDVLEDSPIKTIPDIARQDRPVRIGTLALGTDADTENNALLRKYNIPKDKTEYVILSESVQIQALKQGLIDIAILHQTYFTTAESQGGIKVLATSLDAFGSAGGTSLLFFTKDFIKNHPDAVRKFIKAYKDTERWINSHRDEAGALTAKDIGLERASVHYYSNSGKVNETQFQCWIDALAADGVIKKGEFKPKDLYTDAFKDVW